MANDSIPVLITCGTGIVCSTIVLERLKDHYQGTGTLAQVDFTLCAVRDIAEHLEGKAFVVAVVPVPEGITIPVMDGNKLLYDEDAATYERFEELLARDAGGTTKDQSS